jgi:hypothetical protein
MLGRTAPEWFTFIKSIIEDLGFYVFHKSYLEFSTIFFILDVPTIATSSAVKHRAIGILVDFE